MRVSTVQSNILFLKQLYLDIMHMAYNLPIESVIQCFFRILTEPGGQDHSLC